MVLEIVTTRSLIQVPDTACSIVGSRRLDPSVPAELYDKGFGKDLIYSSGSGGDPGAGAASAHYLSTTYSNYFRGLKQKGWDGDEGSISQPNFLRVKLPAPGMFEEQEISAFVRECPIESEYEELLPYSNNSCQYESIYSEPIYHGDSGCDSVSTCNGGITNEPLPPLPLSEVPPSPRGNRQEYPRIPQCPPPNNNNPGSNNWLPDSSSSGYHKFLPPIPKSSSGLSTRELPNKISTMARSAGRKLAKKVLSIRRPSRSSLGSSSGSSNTYYGSSSHYNVSNPPSRSGSSLGQRAPSSASRYPLSSPEPKLELVRRNTEPTITSSGVQDSDDFEDSDFYDSDSEIIRNFVAAVQPIYSMEEEPLYQYYTYGINLKPEDDYQPIIPNNLGLTLDMLVPSVGQRTLWCQLPDVQSSGILAILSDKQKQLQEAIFEILTSEVSYLKSLEVLISLFYESHELTSLLTQLQIKFLFGNISQVRDCSQSFLTELLNKWNESWYIQDIGQLIKDYGLSRFPIYIAYCRNKPHQDRTLNMLRLSNPEFVNTVRMIEENSRCQMLKMESFLLLPMQRITRLPLLVNAVLQRTLSLKEKTHCEEALQTLTSLVIECNEAARESQNAEETAAIIDKIELPRDTERESLGQFILKSEFMKNPYDQGNKRPGEINWTFRKSKCTIFWLFLFSNQLVLAKKKSSGRYLTMDLMQVVDCQIKPLPYIAGASKEFQYYFMLHFNRKDAVYFLGSRTQTEIDRWVKKLEELKSTTIKDETKTTTMTAIFPFVAQREDELSFQVGDLLCVKEMQPDGWYYGSKKDSSSNESGWFPGNYCSEI